MNAAVVVVGSGPSGVHFAQSLLCKGYRVTMLDVGRQRPPAVNAEDSFVDLKTRLDDPARYFLGENYEGVLLPDHKKEYYGIPPSKEYVFDTPPGFDYRSEGFAPLFSFAEGGLAEVWTGGCYPFSDSELTDFPFGYAEIEPFYSEVARRIGITGTRDDLAKFFPVHEGLLEPLELDQHSAVLLADYERQRPYLNHRLSVYLGRTRIATLSRDLGKRKKCTYLGRCLWGCPNDALYTPSLTLAQCREHPNFTYMPGVRVSHFKFTCGNRISSVVAESVKGGAPVEIAVDRLVLAAGALGSSKIFLESVLKGSGTVAELSGLMDNRQVLVPFLNLNLIGRQYDPNTYQYHQLGIGIEADDPRFYVHALVTTLKTALLHPIIQNLPCDLRTAIFLVRNLHCGLGIINVNFHEVRREGNFVTLEKNGSQQDTRMVMHYTPAPEQKQQMAGALKTLRKALWRLGCVVPPGMSHVRPMGASAHYAGTLPMSKEKRRYTTSEYCQSHDFENLFIVDGATYPFLPAKNVTFTLMANAVRVAEMAF